VLSRKSRMSGTRRESVIVRVRVCNLSRYFAREWKLIVHPKSDYLPPPRYGVEFMPVRDI
jgi:hypothetical protein